MSTEQFWLVSKVMSITAVSSHNIDVQRITHIDILQHSTGTCPARCFLVLPECVWEGKLPQCAYLYDFIKVECRNLWIFKICSAEFQPSYWASETCLRRLNFAQKLWRTFIPRPAHSLTYCSDLLCTTYKKACFSFLFDCFGGIVKMHFFFKRKKKFEWTWQVPQTVASVPAAPCDPRILASGKRPHKWLHWQWLIDICY